MKRQKKTPKTSEELEIEEWLETQDADTYFGYYNRSERPIIIELWKKSKEEKTINPTEVLEHERWV